MPRKRSPIEKLVLCNFLAMTMAGCAQQSILCRNEPQDKQAVRPLPHVHAHNDYKQRHPLKDALSNGFLSVEADVFLDHGHLLVGHSREEIQSDGTIQSLYLDPLMQLFNKNNGAIYPGSCETLVLLVDIKSAGLPTYKKLDEILEPYQDMVTTFHKDGTVEKKAVTVIVSGNRPKEYMMEQEVRYAACDGRWDDLDRKFPASFMPLISSNWNRNFSWRGKGEIPEDQKVKLVQFVQTAHESGQKVRFWATPEKDPKARAAVWHTLIEAGVDLINTDHLTECRMFFADEQCDTILNQLTARKPEYRVAVP